MNYRNKKWNFFQQYRKWKNFELKVTNSGGESLQRWKLSIRTRARDLFSSQEFRTWNETVSSATREIKYSLISEELWRVIRSVFPDIEKPVLLDRLFEKYLEIAIYANGFVLSTFGVQKFSKEKFKYATLSSDGKKEFSSLESKK